MAFGDIHGKARVNPRLPAGFSVCDYCFNTFNLIDLKPQFEWSGTTLRDTGFLACWNCLSKPQEQLRSILLPLDPQPLNNPRPLPYPPVIGLEGFTQYTFAPSDTPEMDKADVLAKVATASGIATPAVVTDRSGTVTSSQIAQQMMAANAARNWLLIYAPAVPVFGISKTTATFGQQTTVNTQPEQTQTMFLGPGQAFFWSTSQGNGTAYRGALSVIALQAGTPWYAWESAG